MNQINNSFMEAKLLLLQEILWRQNTLLLCQLKVPPLLLTHLAMITMGSACIFLPMFVNNLDPKHSYYPDFDPNESKRTVKTYKS